jgi:hypothetical protein
MKAYLLSLVAIVLMAGTVSAQHNNFGIKAGLNSYNINNEDNDAGFDSKIGFHIGIISHIHLANQFAFQPELVFSMQGAEFRNDNVTTKLNLNYVNVPLLFQYMFDNGFRIQAGPQVGFLVSAKAETNNTSNDVKDDFKGIELGVSAGASYVHPPSGFGVDARYNFGLSKINETGSDNAYNRGFQIGVFYLFRHGS